MAEDPADHHQFLSNFVGQREMRSTSLGLDIATKRGNVKVLTPYGFGALFGQHSLNALSPDRPQLAALEIRCNSFEQRRVISATDLFGCTLILEPCANS